MSLADLLILHGLAGKVPRLPMITIKLLPKTSSGIYPLDADRCARWLLSDRAPKRRGQSHLRVIRRVAELADGKKVVFVGGGKLFTPAQILELIDEQGRLAGKDPRPMLVRE
jgi:hypothetical protein